MTLTPAALAAPPKLAAGATFWLGFSGGLDSTVLLHLLQGRGLPLKALHVNHGLQPVAGGWVEHCRAVATEHGVPLYVMEVRVDPKHPAGPEAAAREARHAAFRGLMKPGDCLVTAHQQDDQAETVLLRLLRGSGVAGLAAMRTVSAFPPGFVWRPLLAVSRRDLRAHAEQHRLKWVEDPHNRDPRYSRSFLRMEIFSRLAPRWPGAVEGLARTADHCSEAVALLDELATADLRRTRSGDGLSVQRLLKVARPRRSNLVRFWIARRGLEAPSADALRRLEREVLRARPDATPILGWGGTELRRFRDTLHALRRLPPAPGAAALSWDGRAALALPPGCGALTVQRAAAEALPLEVRFARSGERLKPAGARLTRSLRNLFQEAGMPPWVRERLPLIYRDGVLESVAGRWETTAFRALRRRARLRFAWEHALPGAL